MKKELKQLRNQIEETSGEEQKKLYVEYCSKLAELKERGEIREEEAADEMVESFFLEHGESAECDAIFDAAADTEIPREISNSQPLGQWDQKTADVLKQREWAKLVAAIENAKRLQQNLNNAVVEINEVEYLITPDAASAIESEQEVVALRGIVDGQSTVFPLPEIRKAIEAGIVDRL